MSKYSASARWSFRLALMGIVIVTLAVFVQRLELMDFRVAMAGLVGGFVLGLLAVFMSVISLLLALRAKASGIFSAWAGLILGLLVTSPVLMTIYAASSVPAIHDISTDLKNPPEFVAMLALRTDNHNPLDRKNPTELATLQQVAYPGIVPVFINQNVNQVFEKAHALVIARGWEIVAASAQQGRIEATATTPIMGFKDDIVIRLRGASGGTMVDMRSVSRVGKSDLGANAKRIEEFMVALRN
ncbi:MAG: DUF1499 domain-containing protein [Nitrosomonas sp.]|nr:DUF1499 domain-containing protein [Nitrosomonas sp.]